MQFEKEQGKCVAEVGHWVAALWAPVLAFVFMEEQPLLGRLLPHLKMVR